MTREEEIIKEANEYCNGNRGNDARVRIAFLMGANYADEHPSQETIIRELKRLNYNIPLTLNGDLPTQEQLDENFKLYFNHLKQQFINKTINWLALNAQLYGGFNPGYLEDMVTKFKQAMLEE